LFSAGDFLLVTLADLRANGFGSAFDGFGGDIQTRRAPSSVRTLSRSKTII
jgi:hypothetical protein